MAATNYTPIQLYHSTTTTAVPVNTNLVDGELAINITDGKLFYKDNSGTVQVIATKATGTIGGSTTQVQYNNAGVLAGSANFTFNGTTATINTLNLTNALGAAYGGTAQSSYTQGDIIYATGATTLAKLGIGLSTYILTSNGTIPGWSAPSAISVSTATNLAGGAGGSVPYQSGAGATTFLSIGTANQVLTSSGTAPQWSSGLSITTLTASDAVTFSAITQNIALGTSQTSGTFTVGGAAQTGNITLDQSTKAHTLNIGSGATENATTKTINIGTGGVSGSTTTMTIGSTNGTTITLNGTVTAATFNSTTIDTTNLEVTNIKAKDGTAAMSIADSTGVVSITANPILSGGTANGVVYLNASKVATTGTALVFDGTNLGVGGSPAYRVHGINNTDAFSIVGMFENTSTGASAQSAIRAKAGTNTATMGVNGSGVSGAVAYIGSDQATPLLFYTGNSYQYWQVNSLEKMRLTSTGTLNIVGAGTAGSTQAISFNGSTPVDTLVTTSGGNVGIGTNAPGAKLVVYGTSGTIAEVIENTSASGYSELTVKNSAASGRTYTIGVGGNSAASGFANNLYFYDGNASATRLTLDSSGNLGLGVTPSAWGLSGAKTLQINNAAFWGYLNNAYVSANNYNDGTGNKYIATGFAARYQQATGQHIWETAPSGTAGNAISFTQAMTLDASGNLLVGTTSASSLAQRYIDINATANCGVNLKAGDVGQGYIYADDATNEMRIAATGASNVNALTMYAGGGERARITSGGDVYIGNTSFTSAQKLSVAGSAIFTGGVDAQGAYITRDGANGGGVYSSLTGNTIVQAPGTTNSVIFQTNSNERARIDSAGNFGLGVTPSASYRMRIRPSGQQSLYIDSTSTATDPTLTNPTVLLQNQSATNGNFSSLFNFDATAGGATSGITFFTDTHGASFAGSLRFYTANAGTVAERARITSGGYFKASNNGTYQSSTSSSHEFYQSAAASGVLITAANASFTDNALLLYAARNTTNNTFYAMSYYNTGASAYKFRVADSGDVTNTNGTYGTISDQKMKTDIVDAGSQWADIKALRFRKFKMKDDPSGLVQLGVVAQEVELTSPGLVDEHQDRDAEGNDLGTTTKSVKTSVLLMKAAVALQEAMARIETLEAEVAALKGA